MPREHHLHGHPQILARARAMRHDSAPAETRLWQALRAGQLDGLKFRRQQPLERFIADFFCPAARVVIEVDGDSHDERRTYDEKRTEWMQTQMLQVIRSTNDDVFRSLDAVLEEILRRCSEKARLTDTRTVTPHPSPPPQGGREGGRRA